MAGRFLEIVDETTNGSEHVAPGQAGLQSMHI
jgi:hypothetical protein